MRLCPRPFSADKIPNKKITHLNRLHNPAPRSVKHPTQLPRNPSAPRINQSHQNAEGQSRSHCFIKFRIDRPLAIYWLVWPLPSWAEVWLAGHDQSCHYATVLVAVAAGSEETTHESARVDWEHHIVRHDVGCAIAEWYHSWGGGSTIAEG